MQCKYPMIHACCQCLMTYGHHSTPDRYVEIGGSKLNEVSYQLARAYCVPCRGVYVAEPSGSTYHTTKKSALN